MPDIVNTTRAQTLFLRAFRTHPAGPPPECWPAPAVFRRWLRRPAFRSALESVLAALRYQTDLHLALAACNSARMLAAAPAEGAQPPSPKDLLRLHHLRQRFPAARGYAPPVHKNLTDPPEQSEREMVRSYSGEEGVKSYDELVEMRERRRQREQAQTQHHPQPQPTPTPPAPRKKPYLSPDDFPSEREWIRHVNGEQAALAFDRFIALKKQKEMERTQASSPPNPHAPPANQPQ